MTIVRGDIRESAHVFVEKFDDEQVSWAAKRLDRLADPARDVYRRDLAAVKVKPYDLVDIPFPHGNRLTTTGIVTLLSRLNESLPVWLAATAGSAWTGLGVGTSTTGDAISDTNLIGTKSFRRCDDGYMYSTGAGIYFVASFQTGEANFAWNEYGAIVPFVSAVALTGSAVSSKPTNYTLLNRKAPAGLGTKSSGVWVLTMELLLT